jgi:hypothetical protein
MIAIFFGLYTSHKIIFLLSRSLTIYKAWKKIELSFDLGSEMINQRLLE